MIMKNYNFNLCQNLIRRYKSCVEASLGMKEDWDETSDVVYKNGKWLKKFPCEIRFINSSIWATPTLEIILTNGDKKQFDCFIEVNE